MSKVAAFDFFIFQLKMRSLTVFMARLGATFGLLGVHFTPHKGVVTCAESCFCERGKRGMNIITQTGTVVGELMATRYKLV